MSYGLVYTISKPMLILGWRITLSHADEYDSEDEDNDIWAADPDLTGLVHRNELELYW